MIKGINNKILLPLVFFASILALVSACKKTDEINNGKVELLSFGPSGAKHGDTIYFIGHNLQKVTAIQLTGVTVASAAFLQQTSERITFLIPTSTQEGYATLKTPDGDVVSKTKINFNVTIKITSMTKQAKPGDNISIKGEYLNWIKQIVFAKDIAETTFVSKTYTELVVKVPAAAQTGKLLIYYVGTKPLTIETDSVLVVTLPAVTAMAPNPVLHATNLTVTGTNLDLVKEILFPNVTTAVSTFVSRTPTEIVVKVPGATKKGKLTLVANSGVKVASDADLDVVFPVITALSPNPVDHLVNLTIAGTNLNLVTGITFIGVAAPVTTFVSQSATQIVVTVPAGALKGKLSFSVLNSTLTAESDVLDYIGGLPPLADFAYPIYTDGLKNGFQDWSWAGRDMNSTEVVRQGTTSIKAMYGSGGYEGITLHNDGGPATSAYTKLEFSVFGTAGTGGKNVNLVINGGWGSPYVFTVMEGEWKTYSFNISDIGNPAALTEIIFQSAGWSGNIYIDHVGLR